MSGEDLLRRMLGAAGGGETMFFVDYDGTLREFEGVPDAASPSPEITGVLSSLAALPLTSVWIVSGRSADVLGQWLGGLGVGLAGEHGNTVCLPGEDTFEGTPGASMEGDEWRDAALPLLEEAAARVPGSHVEQKKNSLVWHYRQAADKDGAGLSGDGGGPMVASLLDALRAAAPNAKVRRGDMIVEACVGWNKGTFVEEQVSAAPPGATFVCFGDDSTDEDMFAALQRLRPDAAATCVVGTEERAAASAASFSLRTPADVRAVLATYVQRRSDQQQPDQ